MRLKVASQIFMSRKGLENEAFSNWNPQAETALFAEENRAFQACAGTHLFIHSVPRKKLEDAKHLRFFRII